jgi:hypothetical protein
MIARVGTVAVVPRRTLDTHPTTCDIMSMRTGLGIALLGSLVLLQCSSSSSGGGASAGAGCKSMSYKAASAYGCICGDPGSYAGETDFGKACNPTNVGERSVCCKYTDSCICERSRCGTSSVDGQCVCGIGLGLEVEVASCTGAAANCCQQEDTGYCYCRDDACGFGSYPVATCEPSNGVLRCPYDEPPVESCG